MHVTSSQTYGIRDEGSRMEIDEDGDVTGILENGQK